jgi:hypothetical protein
MSQEDYGEPPLLRLDGIPKTAGTASAMLLLFGLIAFVAALLTDPERAWRAYLMNWLLFTSIASGATILAVVVVIARGLWSQPIRRFALSFVAFLPISFVLFIPLLFVTGHIFPWLHTPLPQGKQWWLNVPFVAARNLIALAAFDIVALIFAFWSLRPDVGLNRDSVPAHLRGLYERMTDGWRGQEQEEVRASRKTNKIGPILVLLYATALTFVAFDFVMSLEPSWQSTLIGAYFFMSAFLGGIAATALLTTIYTRSLKLENIIPSDSFHDLGKLQFAFSIFWAYLFWAQFIVIWYGELTHEQSWIIRRFSPPYSKISFAVLLCLFVIPFFGLLGVKPKKTPYILATFSCIVLFGLWIERYLLVYPSLYVIPHAVMPGWQEVGVGFLFAGLMVGSLAFFGSRFPLFQMWRTLPELELLGAPDQLEQPGEEGIA